MRTPDREHAVVLVHQDEMWVDGPARSVHLALVSSEAADAGSLRTTDLRSDPRVVASAALPSAAGTDAAELAARLSEVRPGLPVVDLR